MKKFLILHYGFEHPTAEEMDKWNGWFELIADRQIERGHIPNGREITDSGITERPFGKDSITGYTMITAEDLDEATEIAQQCPIVASTIVYEVNG